MVRPMQGGPFNSLVGAPAPNVTITHQGYHNDPQFPPTATPGTTQFEPGQFPPTSFAAPQQYGYNSAVSQYPPGYSSGGFTQPSYPTAQTFQSGSQQFHQPPQQMFETPPTFIDSSG